MMQPWMELLAAAHGPATDLAAAIADPGSTQLRLLMRLITENADTEFGRRHDFSRLRSYQDYQAAVPIVTYDGISSDIERIADGAKGVLTAAPVVAFEETSGTASAAKLIPYTAAGLNSFRAAVLPWLADLTRQRPGILAGPAYVTISPATRQPRTAKCGIPVGLSDAEYLGSDLISALVRLMAVPPAVGAIEDVENWQIATLTHLIERHDLAFVSVWSPTFLEALVDALPRLADQVRHHLSPPGRSRLDQAVVSRKIDTHALWPNLDTISCWRDGTSAIFARRLSEKFPHAFIEPKGLFSTEAAITLPWSGGHGAIPALTSTFIEFIDPSNIAHLADALMAGASYRVVITTASGLFRYDMGDVVRCVGHCGSTPRLIFEGRATLLSDLTGEKLDEAFVAECLSRLPVAAALVAKTAPWPHYELRLDDECDVEAARTMVETALCANPQYAHARRMGQLAPIAATMISGFVADAHLARVRAGARLGDLKHAALILASSPDHTPKCEDH